ncbi:outer membrane protein [Asticcacaulis sp. W401b]|uniref:outer membrane protein n=1 Tax=Asticcacaulis sp. W401b TaxID=3388666 RepID=UPI003970CC23
MTRFALSMLATVGSLTLAAPTWAQEWSGPYVGVGLGDVSVGKSDETVRFDTNLDGQFGDTVNTAAGANAFSPGFCGGMAAGRTPAEGCIDDRTRGGPSVSAGYDWQMGNWVFGIVGDATSVDIIDSVSAYSTTPAAYTFTRKLDYIAGLRGKVGYASENWLVYATGGAAWTEIERQFATTNALNSFTATDGEDEAGYQIGLGFEHRIDSGWTIGLEYLRTSFDDEAPIVRAGPSSNTFASNPFLIVNSAGTDMRRSEDKIEIDQVSVIVRYRFGG